MAYVVLYYKEQEIGRCTLDRPMTVGRSPDCDFSFHDVMLSRHHCKLEPEGNDWVVVDMGSKNGTRVGDEVVTRKFLEDGDIIQAGKSSIRFLEGELAPGEEVKPPKSNRPADPFEALAGTVSGFVLEPRGPIRNTDKLPTPKPAPQLPPSYAQQEVHGLVTELVSSSWDSIYEEARRRDTAIPQSPLIDAVRKKRARDPHVSLNLQVHPDHGGHRSAHGSDTGHARVELLEPPKPVGRIRSFFRRLWGG